jgi:two-component system NarL family sensor kinase
MDTPRKRAYRKSGQRGATVISKRSRRLSKSVARCPGPEIPPYTFESLLKTLREFSLVADSEGRIQTLFTSSAEQVRHFENMFLGRRLRDVLDQETWTQLARLCQKAMEYRRKEEFVLSVELQDGVHWFAVWLIPGMSTRDDSATLCLVTRDITQKCEAVEKLRQSEALLAQAEQVANFGSWDFNLRTQKHRISKHLLQMHGIGGEEEWDESEYWERVHAKDRGRTREVLEKALAQGKPYEFVARYELPEGGYRVHSVRGIPILGEDGKVQRRIGVVQDITDRSRTEEDLRRLSLQLMRDRDESRRRTARNLHETAGQSLAALKMTLGNLREALRESDELARELLRSALELAEGAIREVRTISYLMHPPLLDEAGLPVALRWYAEGFTKRSGIRVTVNVSENFGRLSQETETTIFRIVQEALTNVHRYSGSPTATISLGAAEGQVRVQVRDEGCGFSPPYGPADSSAPLGVGIPGMRERVAQLNGVFAIESAPGQGTTVHAVLPAGRTHSPYPMTMRHEPESAHEYETNAPGFVPMQTFPRPRKRAKGTAL